MFVQRLCVKYDFISLNSVRGKTNRIQNFYDYLAPVYDYIWPSSDSFQQAAKHVAETYVREGDRVLDLGAGTGLVSLNILDKALSVIGYDLHFKMLQQAKSKALKASRSATVPTAGISFCQGNATSLPFANESFDIVVSAFMMVYLDPQQKVDALADASRVLCPAGKIVILTSQGELHPRYTTREGWREIAARAGLGAPEFDDFNEIYRTIVIPRS